MFGKRPTPRHATTPARPVCTECASPDGKAKPVRDADTHTAFTGHRVTWTR